jgi:uncharacterized protein (DUF1810 family)
MSPFLPSEGNVGQQKSRMSPFPCFGSPDDMKLRSCATLFDYVAGPGSVFDRLLAKFYGGLRDERTLQLIAAA